MRRLLVVAAVLVAALLVYLLSSEDAGRSERARKQAEDVARHVDRGQDKGGKESIRVSSLVPALEVGDDVDLDRDVWGVVVQRNGPPIEGAEVAAVWYPWRRTRLLNLEGSDEVERGPKTRTSATGGFKLTLDRGQQVALRVRAEGFAPVEVRPYLAGEWVKVEMTRGARLLVRALDDKENPLPDVRLRLFPRARTGPWWFEKEGVTGEDGRATFSEIPIGATAWLEPKHETWGHPSWGWLEVKFPDESDVVKEFAMRPGRTITGTVTDKATGRPIAGARVGAGWTMRKATTTDGNGRYELHGWVGQGVNDIHAHAKGYGPDNVEVGAKEVVDFALAPGTAVKARVVDGGGHPLAGVRVGVIGSVHVGDKQVTSDGYATTGDDGRFEIDSLRTDVPHGVTLMKRGYGRTHRDFEPVPAAEAPLDLGDLAMREALSIEGRVLAADGTPVTRTQVILVGEPAGRVRHPGRISLYGSTEERITDHLGRFRFPDLAPGTFKLRVRQEGATPVEKEVELVDADRLDVEIRFAGGRELTVLVVDDRGEPIPEVYVVVQHEKGRVNGRTDADGRVTLLVEGRVRRIDPPWPPDGYLRGDPLTDVPAGQSEFKFVLERASAVSGKVLDSEGKPVSRALVDALRGGERVASASTDGVGQFTLTVPRDGTVDVVLRAVQRDFGNGRVGYDMNPPWRGELKGVSPGSEGLVMQLVPIPADRTLVVRVVDPDGKPVPNVIVDVSPRSTSGRAWPKTDEDGLVRFEGMLARATQVRVQVPRGMVLAAPPVRTLEPNGQTVELRLRVAVTLAGAVVDGAGKPVARALVTAFDGQAVLASTNTGSSGRFTLHIPSDLGRPVRIQYGAAGYNWHARENVDPAAGKLTLVLENKR